MVLLFVFFFNITLIINLDCLSIWWNYHWNNMFCNPIKYAFSDRNVLLENSQMVFIVSTICFLVFFWNTQNKIFWSVLYKLRSSIPASMSPCIHVLLFLAYTFWLILWRITFSNVHSIQVENLANTFSALMILI